MGIFSPIREQLSNGNPPEYHQSTVSLKGDDDAGAKTGEVQGPRALGSEQILAGDFSADEFPAPGEWCLSVSDADAETQLAAPTPAPTQASVQLVASADAGDLTLRIALVGVLALLGGLGLGALVARVLPR